MNRLAVLASVAQRWTADAALVADAFSTGCLAACLILSAWPSLDVSVLGTVAGVSAAAAAFLRGAVPGSQPLMAWELLWATGRPVTPRAAAASSSRRTEGSGS